MLVKNIYGILRDEGFGVEVVDHSALAVKKVFRGGYVGVIIDSESFGLSAEDAVQIIRSVSPGIQVLFIGPSEHGESEGGRDAPLDLEEFRKSFHRSVA